MPNPIILVHGYSDSGSSFESWKNLLERQLNRKVHVVNYKTLTNEVSIKDIAEGFDRELRDKVKLGEGESFDAIVHSTGMLVIRSWLTAYGARRHLLKRLIGLAPATWGSPLAHKGRSWLGAIFKGNKDMFDPDFLEAGDLVLDGLELGSRFTWDLAHLDLFGAETFYGHDKDTPYIFTLCGIDTYSGLRSFVNEPGMDGTVRWAGCALDSRKITLDLTKHAGDNQRIETRAPAIDAPFVPILGVNHATILTDPSANPVLPELVLEALKVDSIKAFYKWQDLAKDKTREEENTLKQTLGNWQQFVVHAMDERGDPITDYHIELVANDKNPMTDRGRFDVDVHIYKADPSFRCFHLYLNDLDGIDPKNIQIRVMASSGSHLVTYTGWTTSDTSGVEKASDGKWDGILDLADITSSGKIGSLFFPFTTTLLELKLNREPRGEVCKITTVSD